MKKELSKSFLLLKTSIKKHSPEILTGIGIAGMITTTVMAVRATPKDVVPKMPIMSNKEKEG